MLFFISYFRVKLYFEAKTPTGHYRHDMYLAFINCLSGRWGCCEIELPPRIIKSMGQHTGKLPYQ